jgi:hypothetical protein
VVSGRHQVVLVVAEEELLQRRRLARQAAYANGRECGEDIIGPVGVDLESDPLRG